MSRTRAVPAPTIAAQDVSLLAESFRRSLMAEDKSNRTIETYMEATRLLVAFLAYAILLHRFYYCQSQLLSSALITAQTTIGTLTLLRCHPGCRSAR
jgi:hypothetical protein